ncbi:hypothetical protein Afil01_37680 [Actinorhabdospora filicis]|uniref:ABM domain-containing protein n=1 Tax=Actinorhabdospora filicis TaxID=1785913 RepID=A0A9W6SN53_9ACTN|nr:hypothetical protein Afil01_37680 [Actinorhabdospora filicis]
MAVFEINEGQEDAFAAAYAQARPIIAEADGCRSVRMTRGVESPKRFVLLVEWETLEAHTEGFRGSERFPRWRAAIDSFWSAPPVVEHYRDV